MNKVDKKDLPSAVWQEYYQNLLTRTCLGVLVILIAGFLCTVIDFSGLRYPEMGMVFVVGVGVILSCLLFHLHWILFRPSWSGTVLEVGAANRYQTGEKGRPTAKMTVTVTIDRGEEKPYRAQIVELDKDGKNPYQVYAPYKMGDRVVYLRGMKRFARCRPADADELLQPMTVCPYCGHINDAQRKNCFCCGKTCI